MIDLKHVKPYGDTLNDGATQVSFSLPIPADDKGKEAAKRLVEKMGMEDVSVVHAADLGNGFGYFIVYGHMIHTIDAESIVVPKVETNVYGYDEINPMIKEQLNRKLVIVGACTGSDAHTVGIDAIMNMKGYNFHYGLERYPQVEALNMGSQVPNETLIRKAIDMKADAILVSQIVTAKDAHVHNLTEFIEMAESFGVRERMLLIVGGPRIDHKLALELGFDAGFSAGTYAEHVASYVFEEVKKRGWQ